MAYYDVVKTLFQKPDERSINGLPRPFVVELARHPNFTNEQKMVNFLEDQATKFNNLTVELIETERQIIRKQTEAQNTIADINKRKKGAEAQKEVDQLLRSIAGLKIQQAIAKRARTSIKDLRQQALARMEKEKEQFKLKGGQALKHRFAQMSSTLTKTLDQSELLAWMEPIVTPRLKSVFLVHGEPLQQEALKKAIEARYKLQVIIPKRGDSVEL